MEAAVNLLARCCHQVFFYKRAQIFVGDLYGAFGGEGLGHFEDIGELTMFADYRVPVVLRLMGVLQYGSDLAHKVGCQLHITEQIHLATARHS